MFKIWAKIETNNKVVKSIICTFEERYSNANFFKYLTEVCQQLDLAVPIVLKKHPTGFNKFNITRFLRSDFLQSVDFDRLVLENVPLDR
ncbi:MAG: hypothetical protein FWD86_02985 [Firmicutes bacterium]|nr:hypothetical protein [Bacillota bacterium]